MLRWRLLRQTVPAMRLVLPPGLILAFLISLGDSGSKPHEERSYRAEGISGVCSLYGRILVLYNCVKLASAAVSEVPLSLPSDQFRTP